jgi:bacterioferritin-associated ferredoxin
MMELSEWELERETKEKILNKPELLNRLRHNPKISYNPVSGKYRFKAVYAIRNRGELVELLRSRATLTVDQDLLDCYGGVEQDVEWLLTTRAVLAVRNADMDKTIKCEVQKAAKTTGKVGKCSLYGGRCGGCADNKGVVLMMKKNELETSEEMKELWFSEQLPILSEIQRFKTSEEGNENGNQGGDMTHLTVTSTQHMLTKSSIAKLKATARMNQRQRKRAADGTMKTEHNVANAHVLEHLVTAAASK